MTDETDLDDPENGIIKRNGIYWKGREGPRGTALAGPLPCHVEREGGNDD